MIRRLRNNHFAGRRIIMFVSTVGQQGSGLLKLWKLITLVVRRDGFQQQKCCRDTWYVNSRVHHFPL